MAASRTSQLISHDGKPPDPASPQVITQAATHAAAQPSTPTGGGSAANNQSISFAAVAAKARVIERYPDVPLPARQYGQKEGVPAVVFSASEHQALTQRIRHTVIAKFQNSRPQLSVIKAFVESNWRIKGRVTISSNWDARHVVFMLDSEEDVNQALVCPHRKIQHAYFRLFRWSVDYNPKKETTRVTKWIKLPGLPMEFFTRSSVKAIVSSFAHFLDIDDRTHSMNSLQCARACVELDIMKQIPSQVWISVGDKSFYQDIVVEGGIAYCMKCKIHGHNVETCRKALKIIEQGKNDKVTEVSAAKEANTMAGEINKVRNEWTVVQHKRKAVRNPLPNKGNSNNVAVTSPGLSNIQNMIDGSTSIQPFSIASEEERAILHSVAAPKTVVSVPTIVGPITTNEVPHATVIDPTSTIVAPPTLAPTVVVPNPTTDVISPSTTSDHRPPTIVASSSTIVESGQAGQSGPLHGKTSTLQTKPSAYFREQLQVISQRLDGKQHTIYSPLKRSISMPSVDDLPDDTIVTGTLRDGLFSDVSNV